MPTDWKHLVEQIRKMTDLRLIAPIGLQVRAGDVVGVGEDGGLTLEGSCESLLGLPRGTFRESHPEGDANLFNSSSDGTTYSFHAAGEASTLFDDLPSASTSIDIKFGSERSWILALLGRSILSLDEVNRFRKPILEAFRNGVWDVSFALITSVATAQRMTLLASNQTNTNVSLSVKGEVEPSAAAEVKLTASVQVARATKQFTQAITTEQTVVACAGFRVKQDWFRLAERIGTLAPPDEQWLAAPDPQFWEQPV